MDLEQIFREVPESLRALTENQRNLENVAQYCDDNYTQSSGGLVVTRRLCDQALASVAFQIHSVAESLLRLLDLQHLDLRNLSSSVRLLSQEVEMHKERVSRREVGGFVVQRRVPRSQKLLPPPEPKPRPPYTRQPISFNLLDTVGHGVKVGGKQSERNGNIRKPGSSFRWKSVEPLQSPTAPPPVGSFGRPVAPPTVPSVWKAPPPCDEPLPVSDVIDEAPPPPLDAANESPEEPIAPPPPPPPPNHNTGLTLDEICSLDTVAPPPPPPPPATPPSALTPAPPAPHLAPPLAPPPPPLETVLEEPSFPPPPDDIAEATPPSPEETEVPPPPPPPPITEDPASLVSRRSRQRAPPTARSHSLRVRSGPASRCFTRSLFLPLSQSLMIPPPPPFPPPIAPPTGPPSLSPATLPASLQHLDLEIPPPPPLIQDQA